MDFSILYHLHFVLYRENLIGLLSYKPFNLLAQPVLLLGAKLKGLD